MINQHLGEARVFQIWEISESGYRRVEERKPPEAGGGIRRWPQLAKVMADCRAVLVSGVGQTPSEILGKSGVKGNKASGFIEEGMAMVFENRKSSLMRGRKKSCAGATCSETFGNCD